MATQSAAVAPDRSLSEGIDPTSFAVLNNRYFTTVEEMTYVYERAAASPVIALARDFSCAIYTADGRLVCMWDGTPMHVTGMHVVIRRMIEAFEGDVADGDIIVCNDSFSGNSHIGDLVMMSPVFWDDTLLFWTVAKGHQLDTGAIIPTSMPHTAENVWQEGMTVPPLRIYERGERREDVMRMMFRNLRFPDLAEGDLLAQKGSVEVGRKRLLEIVEKYGMETIRRYTEETLRYAQRRTTAEIAEWPDGVYSSEAWIDSDGSGQTDIRIAVALTIDGERLKVDLSGSDPQVRGFNNSSLGNTIAAGVLPIVCSISSDIPKNQGCLDCVEVDPGPLGTITNPKWPAACSGGTCLSGDVIQEAVWRALAQAIPEKAVAGACKCAGIGFGCGVDRRGHEPKEFSGLASFSSGGGGGASRGLDGWPLLICYSSLGALRIPATEVQERLFPVLYEHLEIEPDAAGAGEWIGGPGIRTSLRAHGGELEHFVFGEGASNPPFGFDGGEPGIGGGHFKENLATGEREFYSSKAHVEVDEGERWVCVSSGGGGYGDPLDRDAERVCEDLRDGLISAEAAHGVFGVVVDPESLGFDPVATAERRAALRAERRTPETIVPTRPSAGTWAQRHMRAGEEFIVDRP